ncbi:MAG: hypothetical protein ACRCW6_03485, partial [Mycoplasmoidaceae bacterium]
MNNRTKEIIKKEFEDYTNKLKQNDMYDGETLTNEEMQKRFNEKKVELALGMSGSLSDCDVEYYMKNLDTQFKRSISTRNNYLDGLLGFGGLSEGSLVGLLGSPGNGKSTFTLNLVFDMFKSTHSTELAVWFALEEKEFFIRNKIISSKLGVPIKEL